jgi:hypothetical protein
MRRQPEGADLDRPVGSGAFVPQDDLPGRDVDQVVDDRMEQR